MKVSQLIEFDRYKGMSIDNLSPSMIQALLAASGNSLRVHRDSDLRDGVMSPATAAALEKRGLMENHMFNGRFGMWILTNRGAEVVESIVSGPTGKDQTSE